MEYSFNHRNNVIFFNCVYIIKNIITNKVYVGSAVKFKKRINSHYNLLKSNHHHSKKLQNSWNKHGEDNFMFEIIENDIIVQQLIEKEQYYIDVYNSIKNGYNILPNAGSNIGYKWDEEKKINYSKLKKSLEIGFPVIQYSLYGDKISEFSNMKIAAETLGIKNSSNIGLCCRKLRKHVNGYIWEYKDKNKQEKYGEHIFITKILCPHCQSNKIKKGGFSYWNNNNNKQQMYRCNDCKKTFNLKTKTPNAWNVDIERNEKIIDLFKNKGLKIKEISIYLDISKMTIIRVLKKENLYG